MNDFRSYSNARNSQSTPPPNGNHPTQSGDTPFDGSNPRSSDAANKISGSADTALNNTVEMAKLITKAMNGKSTMQIMQTIIAEAERGKREGTLSNADLDNFYNALAPLLDGVKKRRLKQVIEKLKEI